ncbi:hypothetical protein BDK51DRAFT_44818 [Blyttiomyces helicus]|uniref:Secreted protein n=1 Tax=Blyttiomyces helicus TaxID=388810 RepID=A0A4P9WP11_9FUNG|nr:hypothetical protein BDK51DRAFT_44818 [Blyttiomyces helicus]|eukprot:RKO93448.1 hypothetical protein BDK51DRAFT_44818 [Blyttiomyces helicus]
MAASWLGLFTTICLELAPATFKLDLSTSNFSQLWEKFLSTVLKWFCPSVYSLHHDTTFLHLLKPVIHQEEPEYSIAPARTSVQFKADYAAHCLDGAGGDAARGANKKSR